MKEKRKKIRNILIGILAAAVALPLVCLALIRLEGQAPTLELIPEPAAIGKQTRLTGTVADAKSGVRRVWIGLYKDGKESLLFEKDFPGNPLLGTGTRDRAEFQVTIDPESLGIADGPAVFRVQVRDFSWRGWFNGNRTDLEKNVTIDTRPPVVDVVSRQHYFTQGGAGVVVYRLSEACPRSGVRVGDQFYPGFSGQFADSSLYLALIGLGHQQGPGTAIQVEATDVAGNQGRAGFRHWIKKQRFRADRINISDRFLNWKMPEFAEPAAGTGTPLDRFLAVNRKVRAANYADLKEVVDRPEQRMLWEGRFLRLPNSANRARFADRREYWYQGRIIDRQVHMGIDLASVARSEVPAANAGKVAFARALGIYGQTVILDHGLGLFSMYAHLSGIRVEKGALVAKGEILGRTGTTGMAGGDHLHFSMMVHHAFVNPIEWWDGAWIRNNISSKIEQAAAQAGG